jgi:hypothetical protein
LKECPTVSYFDYNPLPLDIKNIQKSKGFIMVYPNPSNGKFHLKPCEKIDRVRVIDQNGRQMKSEFDLRTNILEFGSGVQPGIYYLHVLTNETSSFIKVIVRR